MKKRQTLIHQARKHLVAMEGFTVEPLEETTTAATASAPAEEKIGVEVEVSSFEYYMILYVYMYIRISHEVWVIPWWEAGD